MAELSPVNAALFAFRKRERAFVLTRATIVYLLARVLMGVALLAATWPLWRGFFEWYLDAIRAVGGGGEPTMPPLETFLALAPWMGLSGLLSMLLFAAFEAACLRWMIRGETGGPLGLNLGADTWRVFAIYWIWALLAVAVCIAAALLLLALRALAGLHGVLQILTMLLGALAPLGIASVLLWVGVRLAPAAATSVAYKRLTFFGAWPLTRGKFWPLLGAFVIVFVGYLVAALITQTLLRMPFAAALMPVWHDLVFGGGDVEGFIRELQRIFSQPVYIAFGVLYAAVAIALSCVFYVTWFGVNARAVAASQEERAGQAPAST
jgi:hypothetical protein